MSNYFCCAHRRFCQAAGSPPIPDVNLADTQAAPAAAATEAHPFCFHCGTRCPDNRLARGDRFFCCHGCRTVYEILTENGLDAAMADTGEPRLIG